MLSCITDVNESIKGTLLQDTPVVDSFIFIMTLQKHDIIFLSVLIVLGVLGIAGLLYGISNITNYEEDLITYENKCRENDGVPIHSRGAVNCWSNSVDGYVDIIID